MVAAIILGICVAVVVVTAVSDVMVLALLCACAQLRSMTPSTYSLPWLRVNSTMVLRLHHTVCKLLHKPLFYLHRIVFQWLHEQLPTSTGLNTIMLMRLQSIVCTHHRRATCNHFHGTWQYAFNEIVCHCVHWPHVLLPLITSMGLNCMPLMRLHGIVYIDHMYNYW